MSQKRIFELKEAIRAHLIDIGPERWSLVRERFSEISPATFWRHAKAVRSEVQAPGPEVGPGIPIGESRDQPGQVFGIYFKPLEQAQRIQELFRDAERMKSQSLDKNGKISNESMYTNSIKLRQRLINSEIGHYRDFHDLDRMETFYRVMLDKIAEISPETRDAVIGALHDLDTGLKN